MLRYALSRTTGPGRACRHIWSSLSDLVSSNSVASGGLAVLAAGTTLALARSGARLALDMVLRHYVARVDFDSRDDSYRWMTTLLLEHEALSDSRRFTACTTLGRLGESPVNASSGLLLIPSGTSVWRFGGRWVVAVRERQDDIRGNKERESLSLHVLFGSRSDILEIVADAKERYERLCRQRIAIYYVDEYGNWNSAGTRAARPLSSVVLADPDAGQRVLEDCRKFLCAEALYAHRGIPYRRGYLLAGVPGSGKTSLALSIAAELGLPVYVVPADATNLSDSTFADALATAKSPSIILIEDIDAAFRISRDVSSASGRVRLTLAGLLNVLDGALAQEGRMTFMTTNYPDKLDPALRRPGRVDFTLYFGLCTAEQLRRYALAFYPPPLHNATITAFADLHQLSLSMAQIQAILCQHPDSPVNAALALQATGTSAHEQAPHTNITGDTGYPADPQLVT